MNMSPSKKSQEGLLNLHLSLERPFPYFCQLPHPMQPVSKTKAAAHTAQPLKKFLHTSTPKGVVLPPR